MNDSPVKRRVSEREGSFGFLTQQIKGVHKDLLAFQAPVLARREARRRARTEAAE